MYLFSPIKALVFSCAEQSNSVSKGTVKENIREREREREMIEGTHEEQKPFL